jgi:integrase
MATVKAFIRTSSTAKKEVNIRFRYSDGRNIQLFHKSDILISPNAFDVKKECVKAKIVFDSEKRKKIDREIINRKELIKELCTSIKDIDLLNSEWLEKSIDKAINPEKYTGDKSRNTFFDDFDEFILKYSSKLSDNRRRHFIVVQRALKRYEEYKQIFDNKFVISIHNTTADTIQDLENFLRNEYSIKNKYPDLYTSCSREQKPRCQNTVNGILKKIRTFFIWAVNNEKTANNPFRKYSIEECVYGTPYYISIDERNLLYSTNLSHRPALETQRNIFIFQCLIGCRVADLYKLTKQNIINGAIEYIARKTKDGRPVTVRVPLNTIAKEILDKYADFEGKTLFPYISEQKYNKAIKEAFAIAGIIRPVVTLDPLTRESIIRPLNEIASSHLARRCFVGNLHKQVKDPNLVGALSGHKEGSKAFARYREIDEDIKKELVKMLE